MENELLTTIAWAGLLTLVSGFMVRGLSLYLLRGHVRRKRRPSSVYRGRIAIASVVSFLAPVPFVATGMLSPILSPLISVFVLIGITRPIFQWRDAIWNRDFEEAGIRYFHALRGLTQAGYALPTALERLSGAIPSPFSRSFRRFFESFKKGRTSLSESVAQFKRISPNGSTRLLLSCLCLAYQRALALLPLLDGLIPALSQQRAVFAKARDIRNSILLQAMIAAVMPWLLLWAMVALHPEVAQNLSLHRQSFMVLALATGTWQGLGIVLVVRMSKYYQ